MKVLHVIDSFEQGGAQRVVLALADWLQAHGVDVAISGADGPLRSSAGTHATFVRGHGGFRSELLFLLRTAARWRPDVLHAHQRREALLAHIVGAALRIPVVEHAHTELPRRDRRLLSFRSRTVFAVSAAARAMVVEGFGRDADRVVLTGNTPAMTSPRPVPPRALHDPPRVLAVGRLTAQKDPGRFADAIATLAESRRVAATWLGDGELLGAMRSRADHDRSPVRWPGAVDDVVSHMDGADVLVMTSRWEGMPLVLLEAMARDLPVVATDAGGTSELLGHDRGTLVPLDADSATVAAAIGAVLDRYADALARARRARAHVEAHYSPDAVYGPVLQTYRQLVHRGDDGR